MSCFEDVGDFHGKMGLPISFETTPSTDPLGRQLRIPNPEEMTYRTAFLFEEIREFLEAYGAKNINQMADALVDIVWVTLGTAHYMGIPFDTLWGEVRRANMEKRPWREGDPIKPRNTFGLEITKPEGWRPPDIEGVLREFRAAFGPPR